MFITSDGIARKMMASIVYIFGLGFTAIAALGSAHGGRSYNVATNTALQSERQRLEISYKRTDEALSKLPLVRPASVIHSELDAVKQENKITECNAWVQNTKLRGVCIDKIAPLQNELANAVEYSRLKNELTVTASALNNLSVVKEANSDAISISRYLAAFGYDVSNDRITEILNLLIVAAVELCGGISLALGTKSRETIPSPAPQSTSDSERHVHSIQVPQPQPQQPHAPTQIRTNALEHAQAVLLGYLQEHGDTSALGNSNDQIAAALGCNRMTLTRAATILQGSGLVRVDARKRVGTRYSLVVADNVVRLRK
jgi:hypothetical protein